MTRLIGSKIINREKRFLAQLTLARAKVALKNFGAQALSGGAIPLVLTFLVQNIFKDQPILTARREGLST